ncbi:PhoH family protein [Thermosphaera chiliense]|uniref:PhoH family protein n=1 Tax=Thermosphaera chiliense TaxID=3402707 RepID=A0A7M1UT27_9CREN|nr:PhoH family protein [Thermosphaera aggregans]QOR93884.1 PhoH family protein [Thermosphaera aggregans]
MGISLLNMVKPKTPGQVEIVDALKNAKYSIVGIFGPTGSGKSLFSILYGVESVLNEKYRRFIIARPLVDVTSGSELTPADLGELYYELASSYLRDILYGYIEWAKVEEMIKNYKIVIADSHYLRGRTFDDSLIFLDDVQSIPVESAIEVVTRIGNNSRLVIAGDPIFQRAHTVKDSTIMLRELLLNEESARVVDLGLKDIVRPGAKMGIKLLFESKMRSRKLTETEKQIVETARLHAPDADLVTAVEFVELKKKLGVTTESVPDALIVVKEGHLGRIIGKKGERIEAVEKDLGLKIRACQLSLDFTPFIRALHPVAWITKHVKEVDFAGPVLAVKISEEGYGAFVGQKGVYIRLIDGVFSKLLGVSVRVYEVKSDRSEREK